MKDKTAAPGKKFETSNVIAISISHLIHDIYSSFLAPVLPILKENFNLSYSMLSLLSVFQRIPNIFSPLIGIIADKVQIRFILILTPAITAISMSLLGIAPYYSVVAILLFVMGVSAAFYHVPAPVIVRKVSGNRTGTGMSFYMLGGEMARTLGPLIITAAIELWGFEGSYKLIPFGVLASFILYLKIRNIHVSKDIPKQKSQGYRKTLIKYQKFFLLILAFVFFRAIAKSALSTFLPTFFAEEQGKSLWFSNSAFALWQLGGVIGTILSGIISDLIGRRTSLAVISIISPVLLWLFVVYNSAYPYLLLFLLGFFIIAPGPILLAMIQDLNADRPAFVNSIYITISFLIAMLAVLISGFLGDIYTLEITFKISAVLSLLAFPVILIIPAKQ